MSIVQPTALERLRRALEDHGCTVRGNAAQCPAPDHDDRQASLSIGQGRGKAILKCHKGCATDAILEALGMSAADLRDEPSGSNRGFQVVAEYRYTDERGELLFVKERRVPKDFRLRRPGARWGLGDARRVLYNLPAVLAAVAGGQPVYVVEGEKDADAIGRAGAVATCNFEGAAKDGQRPKWRPEYGDVLRGATVIVVADKDEAGYAHAAAIRADLGGKAASVVIVEAAEGKDASDHLAAGHGLGDFRAVSRADLQAQDCGEEGQDEDQAEEVILAAAPEFPHDKAQGPLRDLLDWAEQDGLPVSFVAAAAEVAGAGAAAVVTGPDGRPGPGAKLRPTPTRTVLPILWEALIGESGDGKNPSIGCALAPAAEYYAGLIADWEARCQMDKDSDWPRPQALMQSNVGSEAIARWLSATGGGGILRNGELASFLKGLGQYKSGGGSDRYDAMDMWSGDPISIERVGQGGRKNSIQVYVRQPRLSVIGGLVPDNVKLLGSETDGLRARFLPVLPSSLVIPRLDGTGEKIPASWHSAIRRLYKCQHEREWTLDGEARAIIQAAVDKWTARRREGADPATVRTALAKADEQCMRIALVVSELQNPGKGGPVQEWAAEYAVARIDYALGCWLALGSDQTMAFSRKDEVMNAAVSDLLRLIERRPAEKNARKWMIRRDIQRSQVGGATTSFLVDELIRAYLRAYPRTVTVFTDKDLARFPRARLADRSEVPGGPGRGPAPVIVWAPLRDRQESKTGACTLEKLSGPDSFPNMHARTKDHVTAGQDDDPSAGTPERATRQFSPDSFPPDSFPPDPYAESHVAPPVLIASRDPSAPDPRPGCEHPACWDALAGECLTGRGLCTACGKPLDPKLIAAGFTTHGDDATAA